MGLCYNGVNDDYPEGGAAMEMGEKIKNARLEAGLSQRQLCGEVITRNMLSQIEHGTARPSMDTLRCLAARLGKPVSFFLEEDTVCSANQGVMEKARGAFDRGDYGEALESLRDFRGPDTIFDREREVLECLALLEAAEAAIREGRLLYALELLARAGKLRSTYTAQLERRRLLLLARARGSAVEICRLLPDLDEELLLRARGALETGDAARAGALLEAAEDTTTPSWNFLRGEAWLALGNYGEAARCYHRAEEAEPQRTAPKLEQCYRELGDFKQAYFYACKQKN